MKESLVSIDDLLKMGVFKNTTALYYNIKTGKFPKFFKKIGLKVYFKKEDVDYFLNNKPKDKRCKSPDLTGKFFGKWEVLGPGIKNESKKQGAHYKCLCHGCKRTYVVNGYNLRKKLSTACMSCGFYKDPRPTIYRNEEDRFEFPSED